LLQPHDHIEHHIAERCQLHRRNRPMRQDSGVEFEIAFQDGDGPADVEMAIGGVPT
jgi:hypothetical protein